MLYDGKENMHPVIFYDLCRMLIADDVHFIILSKWWNHNSTGTCLVKYLSCLVIDEAHRALGNYSYCVAVREVCCSICTHFPFLLNFSLWVYDFNFQVLHAVTSMILNVQLMRVPVPVRILALTATPGCKFPDYIYNFFFPDCWYPKFLVEYSQQSSRVFSKSSTTCIFQPFNIVMKVIMMSFHMFMKGK